jgi:nucleoside-diphosphate-sugar epimerase
VYGDRAIEGADESLPYPDRYLVAYAETKAAGEKAVRAANRDDLLTVSLRPHLVLGPGDVHLVPRMLARARAGKLRGIRGGVAKVDWTWVDDGARAHLQAADALLPGVSWAGRPYFISQGEPVPVWELLGRLVEACGAPPITRYMDARVAYAAAAVLEVAYRALPLRGEPPITRFVVKQLSTSHWYDISAARRDFGFDPRMTLDGAVERIAAWVREAGL